MLLNLSVITDTASASNISRFLANERRVRIPLNFANTCAAGVHQKREPSGHLRWRG
jgi:hypothetical protein